MYIEFAYYIIYIFDEKYIYRNMYMTMSTLLYISYLFVFRWSDIRRLKSVARCIVPIELVHVRLQTTTSDLVKLCFAWRQKPVKSVTSSTHFLIKKSYWWETYTQINCFVRTSWTTSQKYEQMLNNKNHQLWEVLFYWVFWNLENKMYFWWKYLA